MRASSATARAIYRTVASRVLSLFTVGLAIFFTLLISAGADKATSGRVLLVAGPALAILFLLLAYRTRRISLCSTSTGLQIRNYWRSWQLDWDDVSEVGSTMLRLGGGRPVVVVGVATAGTTLPRLGDRVGTDLRWFFSRWNGPGIPVEATAYPNKRERRELEAVLAEIESFGVPVRIRVDQL
jgi:hypothetical protein